jgi:AIG2-like family
VTTRKPKTKLYLAYGSNLAKGQMKHRCPDAEAVGPLLIQDAQLIFRGFADIAYEPGAVCPVGMWKISASDEAALDQYEGVSNGLYSKELFLLEDGREALIYIMNDSGVAPPNTHYAHVLRIGYRDFNLDPKYLHDAITRSWEDKSHSSLTRMRYRSFKRSSNAAKQSLARFPQDIALRKINRGIAEVTTT